MDHSAIWTGAVDSEGGPPRLSAAGRKVGQISDLPEALQIPVNKQSLSRPGAVSASL
jgi:hypothetical protein